MIAAGHSQTRYTPIGVSASLDRVMAAIGPERAPDYRAALTVVRMTVWFFPLGRT